MPEAEHLQTADVAPMGAQHQGVSQTLWTLLEQLGQKHEATSSQRDEGHLTSLESGFP